MAGIGDSWGTREELLHPRDSHGRFRSKWKMSPSVLAAVEKVLGAYKPRFFQSDSQATQYTNNLGHRKPGRFGGGKGFSRLQADFDNANQDLRDGQIDEPSTKKFVDMMDASMQELPEDLIINHVATPDAFGLTADRLPELEELTGDVIADRGYLATNLGTPAAGGQGMIQMRIAAPKGTKVAIPARSGTDRAMFMDRDQELTITKVKPDGRGGYIVSVVATPKTPGETPLPEAGHQGSGMPQDREANIKKLEDAASARETGSQPLGALPGEAEETPPAGMSPEQVRAQRRAAVLGRGPATAAKAAQPAAAGPAPAPAAPAEPNAPAAPNISAPAPAETPQTPQAPEPPNGATSVVTGNPATSFRDAVSTANLEAPSNGPRRKEWNSAYMGITSGKQQPMDMLRELESDISTNKELQKTEVGRGDSVLASDIEKQEKLADLIQSHFNLGEPKQRQSKNDVRKELDQKAEAAFKAAPGRPGGGTEKAPPGKKTATEAAQAGPLAKVAPKRTDGTPESRGKDLATQVGKDAEDDRLNAEQRARWADAVGAEPASMKSGDTAGNILLDETADLLRNGRVTRPKAVQRLRDQAKDDDTPEANYLRKIADVIEADESKPAKRVPLKKRVARAAPDTEAAEKKLEGRTEKNILTGLNGLSVGDLRALADKWGVETRGEDKKLKLKAALSKELAAKWKSTPELQRKGPDAKVDVAEDLKKAAPAKLAAPAKKAEPDERARLTEQIVENVKRTVDGQKALAKAQATVANLDKKTTPEVKALKAIEVAPDTPPILKKAAAEAAQDAAIAANRSSREAELADPNKPTVSTARLKVGEKLQVQQDADGNWSSSRRKTGAKTLTVTKIDRTKVGRQTGYQIHGTDEDGNPITLQTTTGQNVVYRAGTPAKKVAAKATKAAPTELTKKQRDDNLPELSNRVLAGEAAHDVINDIRGRLGLAPEARATEPTEKIQGPTELLARFNDPDSGLTRESAAELLTGLKKPLLVDMAKELKVPSASSLSIAKLKKEIVDTTVGSRLDSQAIRNSGAGAPRIADVTPGGGSGLNTAQLGRAQEQAREAAIAERAKVPGIDTAARQKLQDQARAALANINADRNGTDPFDEMEKLLPGNKDNARGLVKMAKEIRDEIEATSGPSKISVEDRVAATMLARVKPEYRQGLLDSMDEGDRKHLLDVTEKMTAEAKRVKKSGASLDKIMSDAGIKRPKDTSLSALDYAKVEHLLANGKVPEAKAELKRILQGSDANLKSFRAGLDTPGQTQSNKEFLGKQITAELDRAQWATSAARALSAGDSPELVTKQQVLQVVSPGLHKISVAQMKADARAAGIKLPEAANTKDEVLTELAREMIRREQAGNPVDLTPPAPKVAKKAAPKAPSVRIDARTLVPGLEHDDAPGSSDSRMLENVQKMLDGDAETLKSHGLPKNASPAAIGRWLDGWTSGAGSPGWAAATNTIAIDGAKRRLQRALSPEEVARARAELADAEAKTQMYRAQGARWTALADKLKTTRRTPIKKASPEAKADVVAELPVKKVAKKAVPKAVQSNLSVLDDDALKKITESPQFGDDQKEIVARELARRNEPKPISSKGFTGDAAAVARIVESTRTPVKATLAKAAKSAPAKANPLEALRQVKTRPEAEAILDANPMTLAQMKTLAKELGTATSTGKTKADLRRAIIEGSGGFREDSEVMLPGGFKKAAKAAPSTGGASKETKVVDEAQKEFKAAQERVQELERRSDAVEGDTVTADEIDERLDAAREEALTAEDNYREAQAKAKKAAKKAAPSVEARVEVKREVAAAKKVTKAAKPAEGGSMTREELMDAPLGDLVNMEIDLGIRRGSLLKADRVDAILKAQEASAAPVKKAAKKATPSTPAAPTGSAMSSKPQLKNNWGGGGGEIHFHEDGIIGQGLDRLGGDRALEVDGDRLDNVLGRIATDNVTGKTTQQDTIDRLTALSNRLPDGRTRETVRDMATSMDTPKRTVDIPAGIPAPISKLAKELEQIPLAREDRRGSSDSSELTRIEDIMKKFAAGQIGGSRLVDAIEGLHNSRHESNEGKFELDRVVMEALKVLRETWRDPKTRSTLSPKKEV